MTRARCTGRRLLGAAALILPVVFAWADAPEETAPKSYTKPPPLTLPDGPPVQRKGPIAHIQLTGVVSPGMSEFLSSSIARASRENAQALLVEIDTPGGLVSSTQTMVQAILGSEIPVITFVAPKGAHAASAGSFITMAGHIAAMAPATRIGAAHPVTGSGGDPEDEGGEHMGRKVENDLAAFAESIAKERGRNVEWATAAVRESESITAERAAEIGVVDLVADGRSALLAAIDGRPFLLQGQKVALDTEHAELIEYRPSLRESFVSMLALPGIAALLGVLGLLGIMIEVYHPGLIAPGVLGVLCIICSMIALEQLPIDLGAVFLVLAGIGLLIAELHFTTMGLLGILGVAALGAGLLLLFDPGDPDFAVDPGLRLGIGDVAPLVALLGGAVVTMSTVLLRARRRQPMTGREGLIGSRGRVLKVVDRQGGMVLVAGEYWKARARERIARDEEVEVTAVDGLELEVRRWTSEG